MGGVRDFLDDVLSDDFFVKRPRLIVIPGLMSEMPLGMTQVIADADFVLAPVHDAEDERLYYFAKDRSGRLDGIVVQWGNDPTTVEMV